MTIDPRDDLAALSREFGVDPTFTRAGGGNSSVKLDGLLHIKPSGVAMARLAGADLIALDRAALLEFLEAGDAAAAGSDPVMAAARAARRSPDDGRRPSVEILFHALLPFRYVLHLHPTTVNALTCARDGARLAAELFGDEALWIPYTDPGLPLARRIRDGLAARPAGTPAPAVYLLQSHGLIVGAETTEAVAATTRATSERIAARIAAAPASAREPILRHDPIAARELLEALVPAVAARLAGPDGAPAVVPETSELALVAAGGSLGRRVAAGGALTPDTIVYAGAFPLLLQAEPATDAAALLAALDRGLAERARAGVEPPIVVLVPGVGLLAAGASAKDGATAANLYLDGIRVALGADRLGGIRFLESAERRFVEEWEAEAYRKQVSRGS
jgi:rhamnulokinase